MPSIENTRLYAMYVIGEVESNWDWTAVYRADPITLGMMQEYGQHASNLLKKCREGDAEGWAPFAQKCPQLVADVDEHGDSWEWWTGRYVDDTEANAWVEMAKRDQNHAIQQAKWYEDFDSYVPTLKKWGWSPDRPQTFVLIMCCYHQSPQSAGQVSRSCGGDATLDTLLATILNHGVVGKYKNRYNTAYKRLKEWDGESAPPDFGQVGDVSTGGNSETVSRPESPISYAQLYNDMLILFGVDGYENGLICKKAGNNIWTPSGAVSGVENPGTTEGGGSATGSEGQKAVVEVMRSWEKRFDYSQGAGRLTPETTGYGDCSSVVYAAYKKACGINVGTWTGEQAQKGKEIGRGSGGGLPLDNMELGDLVIFFRGSYSPGSSTHVEMYTGNNQLIGHGSGKGPKVKADAGAYCAGNYNWDRWSVRRYL